MSNDGNGSGRLFVDQNASAEDDRSQFDTTTITPTERAEVLARGAEFTKRVKGVWLLISGRFSSRAGERTTESRVKELLRGAFGYPQLNDSKLTINVLLNSPGGNLDSAYSTVLYLSAYARELNVYVPSRAKSASTLVAIGADQLFLSAFGELGPLDTQIPDPRNPANTMSALDCYQSVDYVRGFGFNTIIAALPQLVHSTERRIPVKDLLETASTFAIGAITPVLSTITALDFGGWGRSLRVGEQYARMLLQAKDVEYAKADRIARQLVYGYTHHPFPIDYNEAERIGLEVTKMRGDIYDEAAQIVNACNDKNFIGFLNEEQAAVVVADHEEHDAAHHENGVVEEHAADTSRPREFLPGAP